MLYLILEIKFSRKSDFISVFTFKSNARETWCVILVSESWHILLRITAHPRGAFISVEDFTPTEKDLFLLTTCRSGSLLDWDKFFQFPSITWNAKLAFQNHTNCLLLYYPIFLIIPTAISCSHIIMRLQSTTLSLSFKYKSIPWE